MNCLKEKRKSAQLSQTDLARQVGLNRHLIHLIENQKFQPAPSTCERIAETLNEEANNIFFLEYRHEV
ncbi:helix-turn-helix transcriptional regulator [Suicoccus acidiformans]|uniref:helix-turn-helix transcriptional regulator n=1 Tax=Suicoccus acidiformans TaxID=2036206 RepID=UPI0013C304B3|nr:helix-turn-helix domain-containing protein [Suicoccus acidiformans]